MGKRLGKKAQVLDLIYFIGLVFLVGIIGIIALFVVNEAKDSMSEGDIIRSENIAMMETYTDRAPKMIDQLFVISLIGIGIVTLASAFFVSSHPIFYGLMIIVMAFMTWLAAIYANVFQEIATHPEWAVYADKLVMASHIMKFYPLVIIVLSVVIVLAMVAKK